MLQYLIANLAGDLCFDPITAEAVALAVSGLQQPAAAGLEAAIVRSLS
ncbi:MAG TPA: hypothetical protein VGC82_12330 [Rhodopila sp.]